MKLIADWTTYLHNIREKEIFILFSKCPKDIFNNGLELGAGDGFQSTLLTTYISYLISTDINLDRIRENNNLSIEYRICDAEKIDSFFNEKQFDIIYSSSVLEHLINPSIVLSSINKLLKDNGITIHIIPNTFWKLTNLLLYYPFKLIKFIETITEKNGIGKILKLLKISNTNCISIKLEEVSVNNLKIKRNVKSRVYHQIFPKPHGVSSTHIKELFAFSISRWKNEFKKADLKIIRILKGPAMSGYGFGLNYLRKILNTIGISSEYMYIAIKKDNKSPYEKYF